MLNHTRYWLTLEIDNGRLAWRWPDTGAFVADRVMAEAVKRGWAEARGGVDQHYITDAGREARAAS